MCAQNVMQETIFHTLLRVGGEEAGMFGGKASSTLASSPGFSLLPRNNLRMTFDPPERKAEGEPGPFSHVIATRIYVRVTRFYVKAALKHGIITLGTQSDHG